MEIKVVASAGTLESSDMMITVKPAEQRGLALEIHSSVEQQFGSHIRKIILDTLKQLGVQDAQISVLDKGALDCTLKARVLTAVYRAAQNEQYEWEGAKK